MKKIALLFAALSLGVSLVGCKQDEGQKKPGSEVNLFNEINEKLDLAQQSLGSLNSTDDSRSIRRDAPTPSQGETDVDPFMVFQETDVPLFVNHQQQMIYIIAIVNYVREHLMDNSYGAEFKYDTYYEGAGFMETLESLNSPIKTYGGPTPTLTVKYTKGNNWLGFESNWNYQSDFMYQAMPFWNMKILSKVKIVFDKSQMIKQIWVNYSFVDALAFGMGISLFDYENELFYNMFVGNSNSQFVCYADPQTNYAGYNHMNFGLATADNLIVANSIHADVAKLSKDATSNDHEGYQRWLNRVDVLDLSQFADWSSDPEMKNRFNTLFNRVYNRVKDFTVLTNYEATDVVKIDELIDDSAKYAFWRSCFIYDRGVNQTYIPFLNRDDLTKYFADLKIEDEGLTADIDKVVASSQFSEEKYIGNDFESGTDVYRLVLSEDDTEKLFPDNLITYGCENGFSYELHRNGEKLVKFRIVDDKALIQ